MSPSTEAQVMGKVVFDISMSLDGFMRAANPHPEEPLGEGGERLHEWAFGGDPRDRQILTDGIGATGAVICGRRTYDDSVRWWGADGPTGPVRLPLFVVSHSVARDAPEGGVYTFVTGGIERALEEAKSAASDKNITVMGGAEVGQQYLRAGLIDELSIHLVPVLFGAGTRMFEHLGSEHLPLEIAEVVATAAATHFRFRVLKPSEPMR
jgi:dihydrofolate reductase